MIDTNRLEPGTIVINSANIINSKGYRVDVLRLVNTLNIYEDVMSPFVTGTLLISDSIALAESLPFIGEEMLILDMETPGISGDAPTARHLKTYHIYKIESKENFRQKNVVYTLCFQSLDSYVDANERISKTYRGPVSSSVQKILGAMPGLNTSKGVFVEETANTAVFTANFWSPSQAVYYLAAQAINKKGNEGFVFFENYDGFIFSSLENLYDIGQKKSIRLERNQSVREADESQSLDDEYSKILDMSTPKLFDFMDRLRTGFYGGNIYHYDVETKRVNFRSMVAKDEIDKITLNDNLVAGKEIKAHPDANKLLKVIHRSLYGPGQAPLPIRHEIKNMAVLSQATAITINVQVFGRLDYTVGKCVDLLVYSDKTITKETPDDDTVDSILSGKYLITALSHEITRESHVCNLELCKDSVIKPL